MFCAWTLVSVQASDLTLLPFWLKPHAAVKFTAATGDALNGSSRASPTRTAGNRALRLMVPPHLLATHSERAILNLGRDQEAWYPAEPLV